jgi:exopolysaccharide biosynthesis protein
MDSVVEAVADWFSPLLIDSRIVADSADNALHPRTALGFDDTGAWLLLTVVDGRQPGFSEGVTLVELAEIFKSRGCTQSINLDGGGSSIMMIQELGKAGRTVNSPSGKTPRPVPVMLGVRKRTRP